MKPIKTPPQEPASDSSISYSDILNWLVENKRGLINPATIVTNALSRAVAPIYNEAKERIATNLSPYGYDDPYNRLYSAIVENKPSEGSLGSPDEKDPSTKERIDLLQMYLGLPQQFNSIAESRYTPSDGSIFSRYNDGRDLYRSRETEERLVSTIQRELDNSSLDEFLDKASSQAGYYDDWGNVLGNFRLGGGSDETGSYVEYGDVWDLNPVSGLIQQEDWREGKEPTQLDRIRNGAIAAIEDFSGKALGTSPATMYGRIYYDPETKAVMRHLSGNLLR